MKAYSKKGFPGTVVAVLAFLFLSAPADAFFFQGSAGEEGVAVTYVLTRRLQGEFEITPESPLEIAVPGLLSFQVSVEGIDPSPPLGPPVVNLH